MIREMQALLEVAQRHGRMVQCALCATFPFAPSTQQRSNGQFDSGGHCWSLQSAIKNWMCDSIV